MSNRSLASSGRSKADGCSCIRKWRSGINERPITEVCSRPYLRRGRWSHCANDSGRVLINFRLDWRCSRMPCRQDDDDDLDDVSNLAPTPTFPPTFFSSLVESSSLIGMLPKFCLSPSLSAFGHCHRPPAGSWQQIPMAKRNKRLPTVFSRCA